MLDLVWGKEDPSVHAYGVIPHHAEETYNLKIDGSHVSGVDEEFIEEGSLPYSSPITMEYDRHKQTVRFTSSHFRFYQTRLPKEVTFAVIVSLGWKSMMLDAGFDYIQ